IRTRSPRTAPPEKGELGSTARTATRKPCARYAAISAEVMVDFPTPGAPVRPITCARPGCAINAALASRNCGEAVSTRLSNRAVARGSPARARSTSCTPSDAHDQGVALAATAAECGCADPAAAALDLHRQGENDPRARHSQRVSERDRATVDVHDVLGDSEFVRRGEADRCKGLVDLDEVEI